MKHILLFLTFALFSPKIFADSNHSARQSDKEDPAPSNSKFINMKTALYNATHYVLLEQGNGIGSLRSHPNTSEGWCYRAIKYILKATGCTKTNQLKNSEAKGASDDLLESGFKELKLKSPKQAPANSVIVYDCGHIEILGKDNKFYSDFVASLPYFDYAPECTTNKKFRVFQKTSCKM